MTALHCGCKHICRYPGTSCLDAAEIIVAPTVAVDVARGPPGMRRSGRQRGPPSSSKRDQRCGTPQSSRCCKGATSALGSLVQRRHSESRSRWWNTPLLARSLASSNALPRSSSSPAPGESPASVMPKQLLNRLAPPLTMGEREREGHHQSAGTVRNPMSGRQLTSYSLFVCLQTWLARAKGTRKFSS
eukprot:scaffold650_cov407-Prasinococcus_capsulatus_cf.AAC.49